MISRARIKHINSLSSKKGREVEGCFVAEGRKVVGELIGGGYKVKEVYAVEEFRVSGFGLQTELIDESELKKISFLTSPQKVIAVFEIPKYQLNIPELKDKLSLVLDTVQDPGNLGTIIRIADWFGIENIICSTDTVDGFNPKVVQATMGSLARVRVHYVDPKDFFEQLKSKENKVKNQKVEGLNIYGALLEGKNIYTEKLSGNGLIVMGNESKGISDKMQKYITHKISIPSFSLVKNNSTGKAGAESLNVAVAAAIICSEFRRR